MKRRPAAEAEAAERRRPRAPGAGAACVDRAGLRTTVRARVRRAVVDGGSGGLAATGGLAEAGGGVAASELVGCTGLVVVVVVDVVVEVEACVLLAPATTCPSSPCSGTSRIPRHAASPMRRTTAPAVMSGWRSTQSRKAYHRRTIGGHYPLGCAPRASTTAATGAARPDVGAVRLVRVSSGAVRVSSGVDPARERLDHARRLLGALDLDRDAHLASGCRRVTSVTSTISAPARMRLPDEDRRREAHLVDAVVDAPSRSPRS